MSQNSKGSGSAKRALIVGGVFIGVMALIFLCFGVWVKMQPSELERLTSQAEDGDANAQFSLALRYFQGYKVPRDNKMAYRWALRAAESGHPDAQGLVGFFYLGGHGVAKNEKEGAKWLERAAEKENTKAQSMLGELYMFGNGVERNYAVSRQWHEKAAAKGDARSLAGLGHMNLEGLGGPQNYEKALFYFKQAAAKGDYVSQLNLGMMYLDGRGIPVDEEKAMQWLRMGMARADRESLYELGDNSWTGADGAKQIMTAHLMMSLAGIRRHPDAAENLVKIESAMTTPQLVEARRRVRLLEEWMAKPRTLENRKLQVNQWN